MARIRKVEIRNYRGIQSFSWCPSPGVNCLIGPGDSSKSSILDAIDLCLSARRNIQFTDADFWRLDVENPIRITITIGELGDVLKNIDAYGLYLDCFNASTGQVEEEPEADLETVLTVQLEVGSDLEPSWRLVSDRAAEEERPRYLSWSDRVSLTPSRMGAMASYNLSWRRGSVLNQISEERADASAALVAAARDARSAFGEGAKDQLSEALDIVGATARDLGIPIGAEAKALLDAHAVSFGGGAISLHDESGVPLSGLGTGSTRLLVAGLQRKAGERTTIVLIDELEYGLEPHRIIRLLGELGAKEQTPPLQVFMATHSPVVLRELSGDQLYVLRKQDDHHDIRCVETEHDVQGTMRCFPEAFLAPSVLVCEGATEIGLMRGLDLFRLGQGQTSLSAHGVALTNGNGDEVFKRAIPFQKLGYRVAVLRDSDTPATPDLESRIKAAGATMFAWREGCAVEAELFLSLSPEGVDGLIEYAIELKGEDLIDEHIKTASNNQTNLTEIQAECFARHLSEESRMILAKAAKSRRGSWFKSVSAMEGAARDVVGPSLENSAAEFQGRINAIFAWVENAGG